MSDDFYKMINADVIRNKEIQKVTGVSPAQEAWKAMNNLPYRKKPTLWEKIKIWWYDITYKRQLEAEYKRGFAAGRNFEFNTMRAEINAEVNRRVARQLKSLRQ